MAEENDSLEKKTDQDETSEESEPTPEVVQEQAKKIFQGQLTTMMTSARNYPPFLDKIEGPQVSEMIKSFDESDKREYRDLELKRRYSAIYVGTAIGLIVFFTLTLSSDNPSLYQEIIKLLLAFGIGMAGGYGIGKAKPK